MDSTLKNVCFVIDSPMNALIAAVLARTAENVDIIYVFDTKRKDVSDYLTLCKAIFSNINISSENLIDFDSSFFWGGGKNELTKDAHEQLKPILSLYKPGTVYFGNCLTNPVALALKKYVEVNHLYHAPGDFVDKLFSKENKLFRYIKDIVKIIIGRELYKIESSQYPIYSLLNFKPMKSFSYIDYMGFSSTRIKEILLGMAKVVNSQENVIMVLLAADEPEPGDKNLSNIEKYIPPHYDAIEQLMVDQGLSSASLWIKEHKSYLPLDQRERTLLSNAFKKLNCEIFYVADYITTEYRSIPGECILKYCKFNHIIAEPSAFLFNVASGNVNTVAAISAFTPYRDAGQQCRNNEFMEINKLLIKPCRVY